MRIVIVFFKYNTFYFTYPPRKHDFSHILPSCLLFIAESRKYHPLVVLLHNHKWLKKISKKVSPVLKQCSVFYLRYCVLRYFVKLPPFNGSPLLCPINATSSFSYVFTLHYPRVLHCRIVPIQKLKKLFVLGRKKPPIIVVLSEFKRSNLKVTRKFAKTPRGHVDRGGEYFHETFIRRHIQATASGVVEGGLGGAEPPLLKFHVDLGGLSPPPIIFARCIILNGNVL